MKPREGTAQCPQGHTWTANLVRDVNAAPFAARAQPDACPTCGARWVRWVQVEAAAQEVGSGDT